MKHFIGFYSVLTGIIAAVSGALSLLLFGTAVISMFPGIYGIPTAPLFGAAAFLFLMSIFLAFFAIFFKDAAK